VNGDVLSRSGQWAWDGKLGRQACAFGRARAILAA